MAHARLQEGMPALEGLVADALARLNTAPELAGVRVG
jgi:hypothetical protein